MSCRSFVERHDCTPDIREFNNAVERTANQPTGSGGGGGVSGGRLAVAHFLRRSRPLGGWYWGAGVELVAPLSRRRASPRRRARDAERQFNRVRHLLFHLTRHEAEVAALDAEVGADDQQAAVLIRAGFLTPGGFDFGEVI